MCRLVWAFAGRTYHIVGNLMSQLICSRSRSQAKVKLKIDLWSITSKSPNYYITRHKCPLCPMYDPGLYAQGQVRICSVSITTISFVNLSNHLAQVYTIPRWCVAYTIQVFNLLSSNKWHWCSKTWGKRSVFIK